MDRQLIDYLPLFLQEYREYKAILNDASQPEIDKLWGEARNNLAEWFVSTATIKGILRYEKLLHIAPLATDTLEMRRFRVLTRLGETLPYTLRALENMLETLCGTGNYNVLLDNNVYTIYIGIGLIAKSNFDDVNTLLRRIIPANLIINLFLQYNQYSTLARFTHAQLRAFTHKQLREDVIT